MKQEKTSVFIGFTRWIKYLFSDNPVLIAGLSMTPIIMAARTLKFGLTIVIFTSILMLCVAAVSYVSKLVFKKRLHVLFAAIVSAGAFAGIASVYYDYFPNVTEGMGIYIPLIVVGSIIVGKVPEVIYDYNFKGSAFRIINAVTGYSLTAIAVGAIREYLSFGTLLDISLPYVVKIPTAAYPYMGFIIIGFLAARSKMVNIRNRKYSDVEADFQDKWIDDDTLDVDIKTKINQKELEQ